MLLVFTKTVTKLTKNNGFTYVVYNRVFFSYLLSILLFWKRGVLHLIIYDSIMLKACYFAFNCLKLLPAESELHMSYGIRKSSHFISLSTRHFVVLTRMLNMIMLVCFTFISIFIRGNSNANYVSGWPYIRTPYI